jgi:hypothetical protein
MMIPIGNQTETGPAIHPTHEPSILSYIVNIKRRRPCPYLRIADMKSAKGQKPDAFRSDGPAVQK